MRKILIGICMIFLGAIIMYFNNSSEVPKNETVTSIRNILVEDFVGTIEIKKSNRDNIIKSDNVKIENFDGNLKIKTKRKNWFNFGSKNSKIVIEYSKDMMNIDVNDAVGDVSIEMPQISNLNITNVVGDINIKSNGTVNILKNEDILGKVSFENITQSSNSSQKIKFSDVVGDINIF